MHSLRPSRGRILFEVFCALAVVSSMIGAWRQTQASALLVAAAAAALLAMTRLFDLGRHHSTVAEEPQRIAFEAEDQSDAQPNLAAEMPLAAVEPLPVPEAESPQPELVEPAPRASAGRRKSGSRKVSSRRSSATKAATVIEFAPSEEAEPAPPPAVVEPISDEPEVDELLPAEEPESVVEEPAAEPIHVPHAPLFEPEPFVRMPRQAFGRRGQI